MWITLRDFNSMMKNAKSGRKKRSVTGKRVASPDLCSVIVQKSCPPLPLWPESANIPHILLDGALTHMHTQFQELPTNTLSTEDADSPPPSRLLNAMVSAATFGLEE
jgi:hypothetical protein